MKVLLPVFYLPPISWFAVFLLADEVVLEQSENFPKQTYRNRATVYGANGRLSLIVPIHHNGKRRMSEIEVSKREKWQKLHWKAIESAYSSSPYFEHYGSEVKELIEQSELNLNAFNFKIHQRIVAWLQLPIKIDFTKTFEVHVPENLDFRMDFNQREEAVCYQYQQVFSPHNKFEGDLSILDAIFNLGPMARNIVMTD
jgi:hypothetical protein